MCIKLHLEENLGIQEYKKLTNLQKNYGLYENCLSARFIKVSDVKYFNITRLTENIFSYYMSPE